MKTRTTLTAIALAFLLAGCMGAPSQPDLTPLEKREIQSRSYDQSKATVFRATMAVLQDHGYTISDADMDTGHIVAESPKRSQFLLFENRVSHTGATAFIERLGDRTTVRVSFIKRQAQFSGAKFNEHEQPVWDAQTYQNFFEALETAIFMRS